MPDFIPATSIIVPPHRQRKSFNPEKHIELCESIQHSAVGLQNALIVRTENDKFILVSGERRLRAILDIYELGGTVRFAGKPLMEGLAPVVDVGQLSSIARMEAELEENILRDDLTWQERATATEALWQLRNEQAKEAGSPPPSMSSFVAEVNPRNATEEELASRGDHVDIVRKDLILARHLDDPDVRGAKTAKEAVKILKLKEKRKKHMELAELVGEDFSAKKHDLFNKDCLEWMKLAHAEQFDIILTDPPYGMGADEFGDSGCAGTIGEHQYDDSYESWQTTIRSLAFQSYRITKPDAHLYLFCDFDNFHETKETFEHIGWRVFRTPLIWSKPSAFRAPWPDAGPRRTYECILFAVKGDKKVNKLAPDVLTYNPDENLGHNAQKPVALYADLLSRSAHPGARVLDPFCGSGTIFPACHDLQLYATGIEIDPVSYGLAAKRLGELL